MMSKFMIADKLSDCLNRERERKAITFASQMRRKAKEQTRSENRFTTLCISKSSLLEFTSLQISFLRKSYRTCIWL